VRRGEQFEMTWNTNCDNGSIYGYKCIREDALNEPQALGSIDRNKPPLIDVVNSRIILSRK
jgi:hypothetical protein